MNEHVRHRYSGSFDAMKKIIAADGVGGLYRGLSATVMKQATNQAVRFRTSGVVCVMRRRVLPMCWSVRMPCVDASC